MINLKKEEMKAISAGDKIPFTGAVFLTAPNVNVRGNRPVSSAVGLITHDPADQKTFVRIPGAAEDRPGRDPAAAAIEVKRNGPGYDE